jgi:hypothetical protein
MAETCGFVYVVNTQAYLDEARTSLASLRRHMPDAQVAIITHEHLFADDPSVIWVPLTCPLSRWTISAQHLGSPDQACHAPSGRPEICRDRLSARELGTSRRCR